MLDYSVTNDVYDIKGGIYSKLNEYMEIYMYQRSRTFIVGQIQNFQPSFP